MLISACSWMRRGLISMGDVQVTIKARSLEIGDSVCFGRQTLLVRYLDPRVHDILVRFADDTIMFLRPDEPITVERMS